jgi:hypothetical protein
MTTKIQGRQQLQQQRQQQIPFGDDNKKIKRDCDNGVCG